MSSGPLPGEFSDAGETALVVAIGRRNRDALAEVYRRHADALLGLAQRLLGTGEPATQVVQETLIALWRAPESWDPEHGALSTHLLAGVHTRAVELLRSDPDRMPSGDGDASEPPMPEPTGLTQVAAAAMANLSDIERQTIALTYLGGHTVRDVSQMLGVPEPTVHGALRSALSQLRSSLIDREVQP